MNSDSQNAKTILITGGAGFIGSHLCERLLEQSSKVICVDNLLTGSKKNIKHLLENPNFQFIKHDVIKSISNCKLQISNLDAVYHLASPASPNKKSPYSYLNHPVDTLQVNSQGTKNMLDLALKYNAKLVYASTSEVYGDPRRHPQTEDYWGNVNPNGPRSCYDEAKRFGEAITMTYQRNLGADVRIARIFNTYGPCMLAEDGRVVSNFIVQALRNVALTVYGDGTQTRSFCYIDDMVEGLLRLGEKDELSGEVVNLGNPDEISILNLAKQIRQLTDTRSKITFEKLPKDDPSKRRPDIRKARKLLDWQPAIPLKNGLTKTVSYFKQHIT